MALRLPPDLRTLQRKLPLALTRCTCSSIRLLSTTPTHDAETQLPQQRPPATLPDRHLAGTKREERKLLRAGIQPIASRRRRAALKTSPNIPFEQLPYQAFQEARKVLLEDRREKLRMIEVQRGRIERLREKEDGDLSLKSARLSSMERYLERLKVLADVNDPLVKRNFEDGKGDMDKPVYRHLADQKWRSRRREIIMQRITQMHVVPDVIAAIDITADVQIKFGRKEAGPGEFVTSNVSETAPELAVQVFDRGERLITIAVIDSDVPDVEKDSFQHRCHFLAVNIPVSPTRAAVSLKELAHDSQLLLPWMAPYSIKGAPYHRLSVFAMEQKDNQPIDAGKAREKAKRDGFSLRGLVAQHKLHPIGANMFRTQWDEAMDEVMQRNGYEGVGLELRLKKGEKLPYKKKDPERYR